MFLFTGDEKFLLQKELTRWTSAFAEKHWMENLFVISSNAFDLSIINQALGWGGLFSNQKMVVIYGVPLDNSPDNKLPTTIVEPFCEMCMNTDLQFSPETILIFVSYKPDKRTKFYKYLEKSITIKSFDQPKNVWEIKSYLKPYIQEWTPWLLWTDLALTYFIEKVGTDLYHIQLECDKLSIYSTIHHITQIETKHIDLLCFGILDTNSFAFFDFLLVDKSKALQIVQSAQEQGIHWTMFAGSLYWGLKLWIFILDMDSQWLTDSKLIATTIKYSPFAISKALKQITFLRQYSQMISSFYRQVLELDEGIKTWKVSESLFWITIKKFILESF